MKLDARTQRIREPEVFKADSGNPRNVAIHIEIDSIPDREGVSTRRDQTFERRILGRFTVSMEVLTIELISKPQDFALGHLSPRRHERLTDLEIFEESSAIVVIANVFQHGRRVPEQRRVTL